MIDGIRSPNPDLTSTELNPTHPIVFFDGECVMCNGFLDWMMVIDRDAKLPDNRVVPYLSRFQCESVRTIEYEGKVAFEVKASPFPTNFAHADILSAQPLGKGGLKKLRCLLLEQLQTLIPLDQYLKGR